MKNQGVLALLLITAGSLIYAATQRPRDPVQTNRPEARARYAQHVVRPPRFAAEAMTERVDRMMAKALHDAPVGRSTSHFICKLPAEVGPVPLLEAVDAWLRATPGNRDDPTLLRNLRRAAQQGNWLAKVQMVLSQDGQRTPDDASAFHALTITDWMQEPRIGVPYLAVGGAPGRSGTRRARSEKALSSLDLHAAMHHHYPSQYKVGRALVRSGDAHQAGIGRRMLDCAARALPVYGERGDALTEARL